MTRSALTAMAWLLALTSSLAAVVAGLVLGSQFGAIREVSPDQLGGFLLVFLLAFGGLSLAVPAALASVASLGRLLEVAWSYRLREVRP